MKQFPLFVNRFGRSLWFCNLEFDEEAILMFAVVKMPGIGVIISDFREPKCS